jgi:hypothetical protein
MVCIGVLSCHTSNITKEPVNNNDDNLFTDTKNINNESDDYYKPQRLKFTDEIYSDIIKSVQLFSADWVFGPPIIWTEKQNKLTLYFDELNSNKKDYYFSFIYCDAMWNPLDVPTMDYLEGFNEDPITSYQSSMNTLVSYIHYAVDFPSENMKPKKSGNYLLHVYYYNGDEKKTIITKRFFVAENNVEIKSNVKMATNIELRNYQHEIDFTINANKIEITDPYRTLTIVLQQNGRTDNQITNLKPKLVKGNELIYDFENGNIFDANNEFRHFDIKSLTYNTDRIQKIAKTDGMFHIYLKTDYRRPFDRYISDDDINGRFLIKNDDGKNSETESEYVWVHFLLKYDAPLTEGSVYLQGAITQWGYNPLYKLKYDYNKQGYADSLLLKQGYYNYQYVYLKDGETSADAAYIEGRHSEADNDYTIYVYYREPGELFDRLIGVQISNSKKGM